MFLFIKTEYLRYSFFNLGIKTFFLCLDRLLVKYKKYLVPLAIIIGFVLTGALSITSILRVRDNYIAVRLAVKIDRFLITGIRGYLVSILLDIVS
jgi:hypothetical protein